jgi:thiol:disulfide interchange protein DsbD
VPSLPEGKVKEDQFFGRVETYRGGMTVNLSLKDPKPGQPIVIAAESQGCADVGLCYPPTTQRVTLSTPDRTAVPGAPADGARKSWFN